MSCTNCVHCCCCEKEQRRALYEHFKKMKRKIEKEVGRERFSTVFAWKSLKDPETGKRLWMRRVIIREVSFSGLRFSFAGPVPVLEWRVVGIAKA